MLHQVDAYGGGVVQLFIEVGGEAAIGIGADTGRHAIGVAQVRFFAHQVDAAADGRNAGLNGPGALEHFGLLQVEGVGARGHARIAHAIDSQALLG